MIVLAAIVIALVLAAVLLYAGHAYAGLVGAGLVLLAGWAVNGTAWPTLFAVAAGVFVLLAAVFGIPPLRRLLITGWVMRLVGPIMPRMGDTERVALEAGTVWWDGELFSGKPSWPVLRDFKVQPLSARERAFVDGPVEEFCRLIDDTRITAEGDLGPEAWAFLKRHRFFGMIIPEEYGGLGFSALAHSTVVAKLSSRSASAAVTAMVPNSLGPGELLLHYGTDEQKRHFLPRLAAGDEIPCFALTEPNAGSDAAAAQSHGIVCRGTYEGRQVLGMRLTWNKRYITLAPVATLIGLAFRLFDPDHLLGDREDLGITCALVPRSLPGIDIGLRHDPLGVPFQNGPTSARDVFVPIEFIIGGRAMAGQGWRMLMESLAAGRSISLPGLSAGTVQLCARIVGAYATVRQQFDLPIGRFEGIEEPLARIGAAAYWMDAARVVTAGAVDAGQKPSVISAIVKAYLTEAMRAVVNDAMDVLAGAAISRGPRNVMARAYTSVPIGITVEGANILTRSMIVYGQGAIRCHPYVREVMESIAARNLVRFDRAFSGHVGFILSNAVRALLLGLTGGRLARPTGGVIGEYFGHVTRSSAAFVLLSDVAMGILGGELKRREKISGRFADALAWMYMASATLKRFWDEGQRAEDVPFVRWSCDMALHRVQVALDGVLANFPNRLVAALLRPIISPLGARFRAPADRLGAKVARALLDARPARERLSSDVFVPPDHEPGLGRLEWALRKVTAAATVEDKVKAAVRARALPPKLSGAALVQAALSAGVISDAERQILAEAAAARDEVIQVDAFPREIMERHVAAFVPDAGAPVALTSSSV